MVQKFRVPFRNLVWMIVNILPSLGISNSLNFLVLSLDLFFVLMIFIIVKTPSTSQLTIRIFLYTRFSLIESSFSFV
uniref:Uncharacterized protein n=1 Tax=Lepeophtheirus salmonis TaxID=72036 RepID=A0A0K2VEL7_LEPSM